MEPLAKIEVEGMNCGVFFGDEMLLIVPPDAESETGWSERVLLWRPCAAEELEVVVAGLPERAVIDGLLRTGWEYDAGS